MEVKVAKTAGFCFGVQRAVDKVYELIDSCPDRLWASAPAECYFLSKKSIIKQVQTAMTRQMINVQKATARITRSSQIVNGKNPNIAPI